MAFITKYVEEITKDQVVYNLQNVSANLSIKGIQTFSIGDFETSKKENGFVYGKIAVRRYFEDYSFKIDDDFEIEKEPHDTYIYDEVDFVIYPDLKIISFTSKERAKIFGIRILSQVLFSNEHKIKGITFNPQKILEAKQEGLFKNVWFNGVRFDGNIQYCAQFGNEIDEDNDFTDDPTNRIGIGIMVDSRSGKKLKVAVYEEGTILCHTKLRDFKEEIKMEKELIKIFLKYSSYLEPIPENNIDEFATLEEWL
jgi:hypothetical protein